MAEEDIIIKIITKQDARASGLSRYFTGKPCTNGHLCEKYVCNARCVECCEAYRKNHPVQRQLAAKRYNQKHAEKLKVSARERKLRRRARDPLTFNAKRAQYRTKHAIRLQEKIAGRQKPMLCEACGDSYPKIVFDHCHKSGKFRGWVCDPCNKAMGLLRDNPSKLLALVSYLQRHI